MLRGGLAVCLLQGVLAVPAVVIASEAAAPALVVGKVRVGRAEIEAGARLELMLSSFHQAASEEARAQARARVARRLTDLLLLGVLAEERGIAADEAQVEARWQAAARSYGGPRGLGSLLARAGLSEAAYRRQLAWQVRADALVRAAAAAEGPIPEARLRAHFEAARERYTLPPAFHVVAALVKLDPSRVTEPGYREALEAKAGRVAEAMREGQGVQAIAVAFPEAEVKDLGLAHAGALVAELAEAVEGLEVGGVAGPIRALRGYYVARLEAKEPARPLPFEQVRAAIAAELGKEREAAVRSRLLGEARRKVKVAGPLAPKAEGAP